MSVKKSNNTVSVISNGATVKKPEIAGVTYAGNLGIPAAVGQPSAVGLTGGGYAENIERYYGGGNSLAGGGSLTVSPANGNGLTGGLYGSFLGSGARSSPVGSLTPATSLAGSALAGKNLTGGLYGQNLDRYFDSNVVGRVGAGIGGGASRGGVTNEGVIVGGSTGSLEKFPTIGNGNGNVSPRLPSSGVQSGLSGSIGSVTPDALKKLQDQLKKQPSSGLYASPSTGTQKNASAAAGTGTPSASTGNGANAEQTQPAASTPPTSSNEAESSEPMTYEEYIEEAKKGYQAQLDAAKKQAEQTRQRAIVDAQSGYMQNLASYGANAEQMADAGMQGGGYSDYLNAQAYAQKRSDVQQANAQAAYENQAADGTYQDYINGLNQQLAQKALDDQRLADQRAYEQQQTEDERLYQKEILEEQRKYEQEQTESERQYQKELLEEQRKYDEEQYERQKNDAISEDNKGNFAQLLEWANSGGYTADQIDMLGRQFGYGDEEINMLRNAADTAKKSRQEQRFNELNKNVPTTSTLFDEALSAFNNGEITQEQYNTLLSNYQEQMYNEESAVLNSDFGNFDPSKVDDEYRAGHISQARYDELKRQYNGYVSGAIALKSIFTDMMGSEVDEAGAKKVIDELIATGWLSEDNKNKMQALYDESFNDDGGGCYAKGTLITMADGSQVPVENLKEGDSILVFNHYTGETDAAPILYMYYEGEKEYDVLNLHFGDAADVEVLYGHGFFDIDLNKYVLIKHSNVQDFIGHRFYRIKHDGGKSVFEIVSLTGYTEYRKTTECYCAVSTKHLNSIANGILTIPDDQNRPPESVIGFCNLFDLDENHKIDAEKMAADIEKYGGLFTYDDFCQIAPDNTDISDLFFGIGGAYIKVAFGKGLLSMERLSTYIGIGADHRDEQNKKGEQ